MRFPRSLVALSVCLTLGLTVGGPSAVADDTFAPPGSQASPIGQANRSEQAQQALAAVQAILDGHAARRAGSSTGRELTLALHELRRFKDALPAAQKQQAERYFLRPGNGTDPYIPGALPITKCEGEICIHYTETGNDAPTGSDGNTSTTPAYITTVLTTINQINTDYVAAGYRTPKRDGSVGGSTNKVDIYIGDIGDGGLYGFCTSDDPNDPNTTGDFSAWAYCALDDDYDPSEFPTNTPLENMRVTAAHEFFHAVQYAYDAWEDGWVVESTATWVEDEMFDSVNDNRNYLDNSPMSAPRIPVDTFGEGFHYGTWIFWRYLTERFPAKTGKLPKLVLDVWKRLDGTPGAPDDYSTQGLARVLTARSTSLKKEMQLFQAANRHPRTVYDEGAAYQASPAALKLALSKANPAKTGKGPVSHLSSATVRFNPNQLSQSDWKLRLSFDLPPTARGAAAVVVVYKKSGGISTYVVPLNSTGGGSKTVAFSSGTIAGVDAVLVNTSARFANCWAQQSPYSCSGVPRDDGLTYKVTGRAFRS